MFNQKTKYFGRSITGSSKINASRTAVSFLFLIRRIKRGRAGVPPYSGKTTGPGYWAPSWILQLGSSSARSAFILLWRRKWRDYLHREPLGSGKRAKKPQPKSFLSLIVSLETSKTQSNQNPIWQRSASYCRYNRRNQDDERAVIKFSYFKCALIAWEIR